jgi:hypothetical protein
MMKLTFGFRTCAKMVHTPKPFQPTPFRVTPAETRVPFFQLVFARILSILAVYMLAHGTGTAAEHDIITFYCKSQSKIDTVVALEKVTGIAMAKLNLRAGEQIDGIVVSKSRRIIAIAIREPRISSITRIIVVSRGQDNPKSYVVSSTSGNEEWCSEIRSVDDTGEYIMANLARPDGTYVTYTWCVVRLSDFTCLEEGLDRMLEVWSNASHEAKSDSSSSSTNRPASRQPPKMPSPTKK